MSRVHVEVRPGAYQDSVTLMQVSRTLASLPGVLAAQVAMGTELNLDVLSGMGLGAPAGTGPNDLVVALSVEDDSAVAQALAALEAALAAPASTGSMGEQPPLTTGSALRRSPAGLVLVSVPGESAFAEAMDAVLAGSSVVVFSDNVSIEQEVALKSAAAERDVLVMGPDCGTAVVAGIGLGFANVVDPGPVSLVAASGTGAQQLMALLDAAGVGVRHCLGLGGRDLSAAVGGRSATQALRALAADAATSTVVFVGKPPDSLVAQRLHAEADDLGLTVVWALLGAGRPDLTSAAEQVLRTVDAPVPAWPTWPAAAAGDPAAAGRRGSALRGLFVGGTLCDEAMVIASERLGAVRSNIPLQPQWLLEVDGAGAWRCDGAHAMVDFGDDALTVGRPHPMIDPSLRERRLLVEAADPDVGVLLLDVVLGHGAHADPAATLAEAVRAARRTAADDGRDLAVVVALVGTRGDPQGLQRQAESLAAAGADVHLSNAAATRRALDLLHGNGPS
ncbi:MAG TPA: hypothetical protein VF661_10110 [Actinomycetales bacterium]